MTATMSRTLPATAPAAYPFTALVGQPLLQRALLLAAIDPAIGGVLISGPRGTAKSTAARALAALLPAAPFVTLPLAASLEQLVGTLDVEDALRENTLRLRPGLLARAHGGVLYVDEVNLLPDALVDALLDAAASGVHTVERDGLSQQHASRFVLVGTMNPEEGALRPQLLDRFGLMVAVANPPDAAARQAIVRARLAFDADPAAFAQAQQAAAQDLAAALAVARGRLPTLDWPDAALARAATLAQAAGVDGVRADLVMLRAARAWAALQGDSTVPAAHVDAVADLALAHRRGTASPPPVAPPPAPAGQQTRQGAPAAPQSGQQPDQPPEQPPEQPPDGDWGALPPQPAAFQATRSPDRWPPKA